MTLFRSPSYHGLNRFLIMHLTNNFDCKLTWARQGSVYDDGAGSLSEYLVEPAHLTHP